MRHPLVSLCVLAVTFAASAALGQDTAPSAPEATAKPDPKSEQATKAAAAKSGAAEAEALLERFDDLYRGESSVATMRMEVRTSRWERTLKMRAWAKGTERSLIRILEPAKEKGVATLKVEDNLWNYLPKVDRTIKVPASMMSGSWMGSHFTNDDLVRESRYSDDFDLAMASRPGDEPKGFYVIDLTPHEDAPVVWGKVTAKLEADTELPVEFKYYDEKGELVRTMSFHDVKQVGERRIPMRMRLTPADEPGEYTEIVYEDIDFDIEIPDSKFSLQALKR